LTLTGILFGVQPVLAQIGLGDGLVAGGWYAATADSSERVSVRNAEITDDHWQAEVTVFLGRRIGVGVEAVALGSTSMTGNILCCILNETEDEQLWLATGRWRAFAAHSMALDAVGGIGVVLQHFERQSGLRFTPGSVTETTSDNQSLAFSAGIDLPIAIASHLAVLPMLRVYALRRDYQPGTLFGTLPSTRVAIGVSAAFTW
jgi:hypothetical protein